MNPHIFNQLKVTPYYIRSTSPLNEKRTIFWYIFLTWRICDAYFLSHRIGSWQGLTTVYDGRQWILPTGQPNPVTLPIEQVSERDCLTGELREIHRQPDNPTQQREQKCRCLKCPTVPTLREWDSGTGWDSRNSTLKNGPSYGQLFITEVQRNSNTAYLSPMRRQALFRLLCGWKQCAVASVCWQVQSRKRLWISLYSQRVFPIRFQENGNKIKHTHQALLPQFPAAQNKRHLP